MITNRIRHTLVRLIWRAVNAKDDKMSSKAALPGGVTKISDIPYVDDGPKGHLLDVYYPENNSGLLPVVLYIHGGGFIGGDKLHTRQYCVTLAKEGYVVFNINYRLAPDYKHPAQITDVLSAMSWVNEHCASYHGDRARVVLAGDSAGAYLAAVSACICTNGSMAGALGFKPAFSRQEIKGVLLFSGLYDLETTATRKYAGIKSDIELLLGTSSIKSYENLALYSVTKNITDKFPPAVVSSGEVDGLHPESVELVKVLTENNIYCKALLFDKTQKHAFHVYQKHLHLPTAKQCMESVTDFLKEVNSQK